jgi:hypothetical protein
VNNAIYIRQAGNNNQVNITQIGRNSLIGGVGQQEATIQGNDNNILIRQGWSTTDTDKNQIDLSVTGDNNSLQLNQSVSVTGVSTLSTNGHYQLAAVTGSYNSVTTQQTNTGVAGGHYLETNISGNNNIVKEYQMDNSGKLMFTQINGSNNTVTATQKGTGGHYLDLTLNGDGHTANVTQQGALGNKATVSLTNAGGAVNFTLIQNGTTSGQVYSLQQSCTTPAGCSVSVTQP